MPSEPTPTDPALTDAGLTDAGLPAFAAGLSLPGFFDVHTHFMPERLQAAVWAHFDALSDPPELQDVLVLPAHRRRGVATALTRAAEREAAARGHTVLTLTGTNLAGVSGTIKVIADDGVGGMATNTFMRNIRLVRSPDVVKTAISFHRN